MAVVTVITDDNIGKVKDVRTTEVVTDPNSPEAVQVSDKMPENATGLDLLAKHLDLSPEEVFEEAVED